MNYSDAEIWMLIALLGVGTYLIRFSFLGLIGDKKQPDWLLRHLRYTPVAVLPGLVAPLVVWPEATGGDPDPARLAAAVATLLVSWWRGNLLWGAAAGVAVLVVMERLL